MANLSNINNKFLVTTGGNVLIGQTGTVGSSIFQVTGNATFAGNITFGATNPFQQSTNVLDGTGTDGARIRSAVSSAANPTFSNSDDTNTGMFFAAADTLGFTTGGTERMNIDSSGNVEVPVFLRTGANINNVNTFTYTLQSRGLLVAGDSGTSHANLYLHRDDITIASGNVIGDLNFSGQDGASNIGAKISAVASASWSATAAPSDMTFSTCASGSNTLVERMRIDSAGNVGIGTDSLASKFEVYGGSTGVNDVDRYVRFKASNGEKRFDFHIGGTGNASRLDMYQADGATYGARISSSGDSYVLNNFGIGTSSPNARLHVDHPANPTSIRIGDNTTDDCWVMFNTDGNDWSIGTDRSDSNKFKISDYSTLGTNDRLVIDTSGNVGINTTSPTSRLDVKGCVAMGAAIYDGNPSRSTTNFSQQNGGSLHINWGLGGSASSGDTITFTYAATSWKSWSLKYNFASTNGITQGVIGGYWNNSGSSSNHVDINNLGMSVAVTHGGTGNQNIIVTFTFTALGTHPMTNFVYMQSGGDGQPRMDRVVLNAVS